VADEVGRNEAGAAGDHDVFDIWMGFELRRACEDWLFLCEHMPGGRGFWCSTHCILPFHAYDILRLGIDPGDCDTISSCLSMLLLLCVGELVVDIGTYHL
jgi:hypothetical protein